MFIISTSLIAILSICKIQSLFESASKTSNKKMAGKSVSKRKLTFFIFFLTYCGQGHMLPPDLQVLNIDQIGQEILNNPDIIMNIFLSNDSISDDSISSKYDMVRCANELNSIMESLRKLEIWPIKRNFALTLSFTLYNENYF